MSCKTHCCVLSRGEVFISESESSCELSDLFCEFSGSPLVSLGNVLSCNLQINSEILGRSNKYIKPDSSCPRSTILGVSMTLTIGCASARNLLLALSGQETEKSSGSKSDKYCSGDLKECSFFPFNKKGVSKDSVVVQALDVYENIVETLVVDDDFSFSKSGITLLNDLDLSSVTSLKITYSYDDEDFHESLLSKPLQGYKRLYFKGVNYSDSNDDEALFDANFEKVLFNPINTFDLINQSDFFTITLEGIVEKYKGDFFKITKQEG